jgi:hypothetical protein
MATVLAGLLVFPHSAAAANPGLINFQGKVVNANGTNVADNTYSFDFRLYTVSSGGSAVWAETSKSVAVTSGVFQTNLGSACSFSVAAACNGSTPIDFNASSTLYLGVTFNGDAAGEMSPRAQFTSVPYAFNADRLGGLDSTGFIRNQTGQQASSNFNISGSGTIGTALVTGSASFDLLNTTVATINAFGAATALNLGATASPLTITPGNNLTFAEANGKTLTVAGTLGTARSTDLVVISQASGAADSTANLLEVNNADAGSNVAAINVVQSATGAAANGLAVTTSSTAPAITVATPAGGVGYAVTGATSGTGVQTDTITTGTGVSATGLTTGNGVSAGGTATTSGAGLLFNATATTATTASALRVAGAASGTLSSYTGSLISVAPTRTHTAATAITDSGNFLNLTRANTVNNAGGTFNVTGALANLQSTCTVTTGICADSANILSLNQQYGSATGAILNVQGAGTGNLAAFDAANTSANGVAIEVQSGSASQYALQVRTGATTQTLQVRADGATFFGSPPATNFYTAAPINSTKEADSAMVTQMNLINGLGGPGAGSAIDFYTYTDVGNSLPGARLAVVDDGNFSGGFQLFTKVPGGAGSGALTERFRINPTGEVGIGNTSPGANKVAVTYAGANSATEAAGVRVDFTPGTTSGGTANGMQIVAAATGAVTGVTENGVKITGPTSPGAGTEIGASIGTGWDIGIDINSGGLQMGEMTDPATPAADELRVYVKSIVGRTMLKAKAPTGISYYYQPSLFQQGVFLATPGGASGATTPVSWGAPITSTGTYTAASSATEANGFMANYTTGGTINTAVGLMQTLNQYFRGSVANGSNGFFVASRVMFPDAVANYNGTSGASIWVGLTSLTAQNGMTTTDTPTADAAGFRVSGRASETTFRFLTNTAATRTNTNTAVTLTQNKTYDLYMYAAPQGTTIYWRIDNLTDGVTVECGVGAAPACQTATLPATTASMRYNMTIQNLSANARQMRFQRIYAETDR